MMNLKKLFEMQRKLDECIEKEHPRENGEDRLAKKILALQVELGELANEWRGFKFWSNDQEPRTKENCQYCKGQGFTDHLEDWLDSESHYTKKCEFCDGTGYEKDKNPLLEEYVDCLHFILSIGNEIEYMPTKLEAQKTSSIINQFHEMFYLVSDIHYCICCVEVEDDLDIKGKYLDTFETFIGLGEMLGFTWDQVEQAYLVKNQENHIRQEVGY